MSFLYNVLVQNHFLSQYKSCFILSNVCFSTTVNIVLLDVNVYLNSFDQMLIRITRWPGLLTQFAVLAKALGSDRAIGLNIQSVYQYSGCRQYGIKIVFI